MNTTSLTLLDRLRGSPTPADWERFHFLYAPLLRAWLARVPGLTPDADDLSQEVLMAVVRSVSGFERRRDGSFRTWLRATMVHRVQAHWRNKARAPATGAEDYLAKLADPTSELSARWDREHDRHVFDKLTAVVRPDFEPQTWSAFTRFALDGLLAATVAGEMGVSENAVILAKARVLRRLREEASGLID